MTTVSACCAASPLAQAGIHEQAKRERKICFLREITNRLRVAIFLKDEIVSGEIADELAMFVANGDGQGDHLDVDRHGGRILALRRLAYAGKPNRQRNHQAIRYLLPYKVAVRKNFLLSLGTIHPASSVIVDESSERLTRAPRNITLFLIQSDLSKIQPR